MTQPPPPSVIIGHWTERGPAHVENEDCAAAGVVPSGLALVLADGMGGRDMAAMAARVAVNTVSSVLAEATANQHLIQRALEAAHLNLQQLSAKDGTRRLGAACAVGVIEGSRFWMGNTGDVRVYRVLQSGGTVRLSQDHTLLQQRLDAGEIEWSRSQGHPDGRVLSGFLGQRGSLTALVEDAPLPLRVGDRLVLCSDGVGATVKDSEIGQLASTLTPAMAARKMVEFARERGSRDDATVIVAQLGQPDQEGITAPLAVLVLPPPPESTVLDRSTLVQMVLRRDKRAIALAAAIAALVLVALIVRAWLLDSSDTAPPAQTPTISMLRGAPGDIEPPEPDAGPAPDVAATAEAPPRPQTVAEALSRQGAARQEILDVLQGRHRQELLALGKLPALAPDSTLPPPLPRIFDAAGDDDERTLILAGHLQELVLDGDTLGLRRLDAETTFRAARPEVARILVRLVEMQTEPLFQRWALEHLRR